MNCGALSPTFAEAELFGHEAGAFPGAMQARAGWFEVANRGTLFLDEIGDLSLALQVKLLRILQEREVVRVGARQALPLDVRLIAATNLDLQQAVASGNFRLDLYYRLNVVTLDVPTQYPAHPAEALPADIYLSGGVADAALLLHSVQPAEPRRMCAKREVLGQMRARRPQFSHDRRRGDERIASAPWPALSMAAPPDDQPTDQRRARSCA